MLPLRVGEAEAHTPEKRLVLWMRSRGLDDFHGAANDRILAKLQTRVNSDFVLYSPRAASTG